VAEASAWARPRWLRIVAYSKKAVLPPHQASAETDAESSLRPCVSSNRNESFSLEPVVEEAGEAPDNTACRTAKVNNESSCSIASKIVQFVGNLQIVGAIQNPSDPPQLLGGLKLLTTFLTPIFLRILNPQSTTSIPYSQSLRIIAHSSLTSK
jgi:hypothetical protein